MRVFNEDKTKELFEFDITKGYLKDDELIVHIPEQDEVQEQFHYEIIKEYENGGKDVKRIVDVEFEPYIPARDEIEPIQVYVLYTEEELFKINAEKTISELKQYLKDTDYKTFQHYEGVITDEEFEPIKESRRLWRAEINRLEEELRNANRHQLTSNQLNVAKQDGLIEG